MSVNDIYEPYFQSIADALFVPQELQKNLVVVDDMTNSIEVAIFQNSTGFTEKFLILEKADNSFEKDEDSSITELVGSLFVMGFVDRAMEGIQGTKVMMMECEAICKQVFDTMVYDSEADNGRALYEVGVMADTKVSGNWATMLNKYWGYRIDVRWKMNEGLYYGNIINHSFSL